MKRLAPCAVLAGFALSLVCLPPGALAQAWPAKPVRVLVGFTAGGATDVAARLLAQKVSETLGQTVVIENRPGAGAFTHLAVALFESLADIRMVHVPYKGSSQANVGVATGETQLVFASPASAIALLKQGRLRALAMSGTTRSAMLPDVPTMQEAGVAGYEATSWYGLLAPAATPRAAIVKMGEECAKALTSPDLRERLLSQAIDPAKGGPEEFAAVLARELPKWEKVIRAAKVPPQ